MDKNTCTSFHFPLFAIYSRISIPHLPIAHWATFLEETEVWRYRDGESMCIRLDRYMIVNAS